MYTKLKKKKILYRPNYSKAIIGHLTLLVGHLYTFSIFFNINLMRKSLSFVQQKIHSCFIKYVLLNN